METWIYTLPVILIISLAGYANNQTGAKVHEHLLLAVILPEKALADERVKRLVRRYSVCNRICLVITLLAVLPFFLLLSDWISLWLAYLLLWCTGTLVAYHCIFVRFHRILYRMKQREQWYVGQRHVLCVDMELSRMKEKLPLPFYFMLVPIIVSALLGIILLLTERDSTLLWGLFGGCLLGNLLFVLLYYPFCRGKAKTYCENTAVNLACNRAGYRGWSICLFLLSLSNSILTAALLLPGWEGNSAVFYTYCLLSALFTLGAFLFTWKWVADKRQHLLAGVSTEDFLVDEDEYWKDGVYRNPQDTRTLVEKRVGYGYTYNLATKKGKLATYGVFFFLVPFCVGLICLFVYMDFTPFSVVVQGDLVSIHAPLYQDTFSKEEIEEVSLSNTIPSGKRTGGAETERYLLGNFQINGYGKSRLYVYLNDAPAVVIRLKDRTIFYSGSTMEESLEAYELLRS